MSGTILTILYCVLIITTILGGINPHFPDESTKVQRGSAKDIQLVSGRGFKPSPIRGQLTSRSAPGGGVGGLERTAQITHRVSGPPPLLLGSAQFSTLHSRGYSFDLHWPLLLSPQTVPSLRDNLHLTLFSPWKDCPGMMTLPSMWSPRRWSVSPGFAPQSLIQGTGRHHLSSALAWQVWCICGPPEGERKVCTESNRLRLWIWYAHMPNMSWAHPWASSKTRGFKTVFFLFFFLPDKVFS